CPLSVSSQPSAARALPDGNFAWKPAGRDQISGDRAMSARTLLSLALAACLQAETYKTPDAEGSGAAEARELFLTVGKSLVVDSPVNIQRVSVANGDMAEVIAIAPKEVLINGKAPGETTLLIWQQGGTRLFYDLTIRQNSGRIDGVRQELAHELPGQDVK